MNWIDVVDSAVKIGLGGAIAGFFGYVIARFNHSREESRALRVRRHKFLDDAIVSLNDFHRTYRLYHARRYDMASGESTTTEEAAELVEIYSRFTDIFMNFVDVEAYVLAADEAGLHTQVIEYRKIVEGFQWDYSPEDSEVTTEQISELDAKIAKARHQLLGQIGKAYGS